MQNKNERISELVNLNEDLENYFANTITPKLFVDEHLRILKLTPPAMERFKLKADDIGRSLSDFTANVFFLSIIQEIRQVIDTGDTLQKDVQTTDMRWYQMNILPYFVHRKNKMNGVIITFIDITTRLKDLREQKHLTAENELLIDTIAHDIKNPLTGLTLAIGMLKKQQEKGAEISPALIWGIGSSLDTMNKVFYDLVKSRWHGNRYEAQAEILDLEDILEDVKDTLAAQLQEAGAEFKTVVESSEIFFPKRKLRSIIYNLVSNAIKYSAKERKPEIHIKSYDEDDLIVISVSDNGIGIGPETLSYMFEKYWQGDASVEGNGVGLYLVKEVLETAGGKLTVESELNKGSKFSIYLQKNKK